MVSFRFVLSFSLLLSASLASAELIPINPSSSEPSTSVDLPSILHARQAIAAPRAAVASSLRSARAATALKQFRALYTKVLDTREEVERELAWLKKCRKEQRAQVGDRIHASLFQLLTDIASSGATFHFAAPAAAVASASPSPAVRSRRTPSSATLPDEAAHALSAAIRSVQTTASRVEEVLPLLPEQRASIEAVLEELDWELASLIDGTEQRLPGIIELSSLSHILTTTITANATSVGSAEAGLPHLAASLLRRPSELSTPAGQQ
ncbi:hypothetical protein BCR35DRAFT_155654 [Leucosporidium creatinivorum]|uniref:Uncharacterized protein n=1 Tax=Leucosporidium creatinivorum TaxID=106004 RepID=A0A1Y2FZL8_9BASI|nr:hypothetical protein BCR35DRAFT_155654 [Leucosporidium creatinivorum]